MLESVLQRYMWVACEARHPTELVDPVTSPNTMHCLATVSSGSLVTQAVTSLAALANASPKTPTYVSPATMADVSPATAADASPMTVAIPSHESRCQEPVLWQAQRLAFNTVDNQTPLCSQGSLDNTSLLPHSDSKSSHRPCWPIGCGIFMR